jgi:hypothetical protein
VAELVGGGREWIPIDSSKLADYKFLGPPVPIKQPSTLEPSWQISARVVQRTLKPGDKLQIEMFVTGYGRCDFGKLALFLPGGLLKSEPSPPGALTERYVAKMTANISWAGGTVAVPADQAGESRSVDVEFPVHHPTVLYYDAPGGVQMLHPGVFLDSWAGEDPKDPLAPRLRSTTINMTAGETALYGRPPYVIDATIDPKAPPGDYTLPLVLTYQHGKQIQTSTFSLDLHVAPFWERPWFQVVAAVAVGLTIAAGVVALILFALGR